MSTDLDVRVRQAFTVGALRAERLRHPTGHAFEDAAAPTLSTAGLR